MCDAPKVSDPKSAENRDYDIFEEFADGSTVWRACVFGLAAVRRTFQELAKGSDNKLFALHLLDRNISAIHPMKCGGKDEMRLGGQGNRELCSHLDSR